jgi:hypothetical protein
MLMLIVKYAVTAAVIVAVSEIAKRTDRIGALIGALPLVSLMVMVWLYIETKDTPKIVEYARYTFWFVLPSLPMFLLLPALLTHGVNFWLSLAACAVLTFVCFGLTALLAHKFGLSLWP